MKIGFTGTQQGMSDKQTIQFHALILDRFFFTEFHHGDCIGADEEAHILVREFLPEVKIVVHPPINPQKRAYCEGDVVLPKMDYLARNKNIVNATDILLATPKTLEEELRSGTWSTIRYARKLNREVYILER